MTTMNTSQELDLQAKAVTLARYSLSNLMGRPASGRLSKKIRWSVLYEFAQTEIVT